MTERLKIPEEHLNALEIRVLACLMEKHLATPKNYPLTPNSLTLACNQKTNREPVMNLSEGQVMHTVNQLVEKKLAYIDYGARTNKISHRAPGVWSLDRKQQAVLSMLMLRAPLTLNDVRARTERMVQFESLDELKDSLEELMTRAEALVTLIPKGNGRREERYTHLLSGEPEIEVDLVPRYDSDSGTATSGSDAEKIKELEKRIERLEAQMQDLLN